MVESLIKAIFAFFICLIDEADFYSITKLIYRILKWDPSILRLTKNNINKTLVQIFKDKRSIRAAFDGMIKLLQRFERMAFNIRHKERMEKRYTSMFVDQAIDKIVLIIRSDIQELRDFMESYIVNTTIMPTTFYTWLNDTAILAIKHRKKWLHYLSMNGTLESVSVKSNTKVTDWLLQNDMGFSHADYKKYVEDEEQKKVRMETSRMLDRMATSQYKLSNRNGSHHGGYQSQQWGNRFRNDTRSNQRPYHNQRPYQNQRQHGNRQGLKSAQAIGYNQMILDLNNILLSNGRRMYFDKKWCAFWNHHSCRCSKGRNCDRIHACMNCNSSDHQLRDCPHFNKAKKEEKKNQ